MMANLPPFGPLFPLSDDLRGMEAVMVFEGEEALEVPHGFLGLSVLMEGLADPTLVAH